VIYAAFIVWFILLVFMGIGVFTLAARLVSGNTVRWLLLPGTLVAEMAAILGCLITGGEVKHATLVGSKDGSPEPTTETTGRWKHVTPIVSSILVILACSGGILLARHLLGESVLTTFTVRGFLDGRAALPQELPQQWAEFWAVAADQLVLVRAMCETLSDLAWDNWREVLFVYLSICLAVRLSPARRNLRPTLVGIAVLAGLLAAAGGLWPEMADLVDRLWPLVAYIYAMMLTLLVALLVVSGMVGLVRVLFGAKPARRRTPSRPQQPMS
jgi:hypothetical protein